MKKTPPERRQRRGARLLTACALALTASAALSATSPCEAKQLEEFKVSFDMQAGPLKGESHLSLSKTAKNEYEYKVVSRAVGVARMFRKDDITEISRFSVKRDNIVPLKYNHDENSRKDDVDLSFDWDKKIATSYSNGEKLEYNLEPGILDRLSADIAIIRNLRKGDYPEHYDVIEHGGIDHYEYTLLGEESITVPAGTFNTLKFERKRDNSSRTLLIWYASESDYLPVRIDQLKHGKQSISLLATAIK